jgi:YD repeat-containing protein
MGQYGNQVSGISDTVLNANVGYTYDEFSRLKSANFNSGQQTFTYTYDEYGNRWAQNAPQGGNSFSASFNAQTNQIVGNGYVYDAAGNLTSDGTHSYQYDAEGNVLNVDGGNTATYVYDAMNRRAGVASAAGDNEFIYDYAGRKISTWPVATSGPTATEGRIYWDGQQIAFRSWSSLTYFGKPGDRRNVF